MSERSAAVDRWAALNSNETSPRTSVYYGVTEMYIGDHGPAVRDADGVSQGFAPSQSCDRRAPKEDDCFSGS